MSTMAAHTRAAEPILISEESSEDEAGGTRSTTAFCLRCRTQLGSFYNAWFKMTNSYYLPALRGSYDAAGLRPAGKERAASVGTTLDGCLIRPLACSSCADVLAILCTKASADKASYLRREFFKLPRMELRCDTTHRTVQPVVELAPPDLRPLPAAESSASAMSEMLDHDVPSDLQHRPSPAPAPAPVPMPAAVPSPSQQLDAAPGAPAGASRKPESSRSSPAQHHHQHQHHHHLHQKLVQHHHRQPTPSASPASRPRDLLPAGSPLVNGHNGVHQAAPPQDSVMDAISRLQTQIAFNTAGLVSQRRDFDKLVDQVVRLETVFTTLRQDVRTLASAQAPAPAPGKALDDATLDSFARNLSSVATKANEVDSLGMQLEIVKRRISIMESQATRGPTNAAPANAHGLVPFTSPHEPPHQPHPPHVHAQQNVAPQPSLPSHPAPTYRHTPPMPRLGTPARTEVPQETQTGPPPQKVPYQAGPMREATAPQYHNHSVPVQQQEPPRPVESQPQNVQQSGWVSVNPGVKRVATNGVDSPGDGKPDESKRPKLAPLEPRVSQSSSTPFRYERMDTADTDYHSQHSHDSQHDSATNSKTFVPYNSTAQNGYGQHHEDNWRVVSSTAPGSVGRDGIVPKRGRGGRPRGRGRKSLPIETHNLTPEWEKSEWNSTPNGQDGYYQVAGTPLNGRGRGNVVRRGSGGGPLPMRPIEVTSPSDPYGNSKKSRTRPFRNADGVLIRKDGRPDMRSQSSAANLRKVHARKEQERILELRSNTPSSALATAPVVGIDSESPDPDAPPMSTEDKHQAIMRKMFPNGFDDQATKRNFHEQYFPAGSSPVSAPVYPMVKPEANTPSERYMDDTSELSDEPRHETEEPATNGHSPAEPEPEAHNGDGMEVEAHNGDRMEVEQGRASASASATPA